MKVTITYDSEQVKRYIVALEQAIKDHKKATECLSCEDDGACDMTSDICSMDICSMLYYFKKVDEQEVKVDATR